jgi:predicted ArsR family transcriptional regulator
MAKTSTQVKVTDDQILTFLNKNNKPKTITQVAERFGVTRGTVRKHLNGLQDNAQVYVAETAKTNKVGRPAFKYASYTSQGTITLE